MSTESLLERHIDKLILLQRRLGANTGYRMLEPFPVCTWDILDVQNAAQKIARFVGVGHYTYIVNIARQDEKVGAHIELQDGQKEVFIEISNDTAKCGESLLAALSHEISHKVLHLNNIQYSHSQVENEELTDVAAVFLGLGKLMLNGSECVTTDCTSGETVERTLTLGYLNRSELASIYRLVCSMRNILDSECEQGLSANVVSILRELEDRDKVSLHLDNGTVIEIKELLREKIREYQTALLAIDRCLVYINKAGTSAIEDFLVYSHKQLAGSLHQINTTEFDPCLQYLETRKMHQTALQLTQELDDKTSRLRRIESHTNKVANYVEKLGHPFLKPSTEMFGIAKCWNDGTNLRLRRQTSNVIAKCPECKYSFVTNSSEEGFASLRHRSRWRGISR